MHKLLVFIAAFEAEKHIAAVLDRVPASLWGQPGAEVLLIDDASSDATAQIARAHAQAKGYPVTILRNSVNQGYGGNQMLGYRYAIDHGFDAVLLLHGDGQYPPERVLELAAPALSGEAQAVLGSRMMRWRDALKGGMPLHKFIGNILLTAIQNRMLASRLSEFHTGFRCYRVDALQAVPFERNARGFAFDTDILIQLLDQRFTIREMPIPTHYGDEISHVPVLQYAWQILASTLRSRLNRWGVFHCARFDYAPDTSRYSDKTGFDSTHRFAPRQPQAAETVLDIGCGPGHLLPALKQRGCTVYALDREIADPVTRQADGVLSADIAAWNPETWPPAPPDCILLTDVLEHLPAPEQLLRRLRECYGAKEPRVVITVPNIAFIAYRLMLLLGLFYSAPAGTLDKTHTRFFTFASLRRLLDEAAYDIEKTEGIPVPFPLLGRRLPSRWLLAANRAAMRLHKGLFAYEIAVVARIRPTPQQLLAQAETVAG